MSTGLTLVWRIGYCDHPAPSAAQRLSTLGLGSALGNGRWHTKGLLQVVYAGSSRALWVPSFVEPSERKLLLNPAHPDYAGITLALERQPFAFDPRLFV
jgi:RES domain-containing protein